MDEQSLRFVLILPPHVSKLFKKEMQRLDRKMLPLARDIVTKYFEGQGKADKVEAPKKPKASGNGDFNLWQLMGRRATDHIPRNLP